MDRLLTILVMNEGNDRCLSCQTPKSIHKETNDARFKYAVTNTTQALPSSKLFYKHEKLIKLK